MIGDRRHEASPDPPRTAERCRAGSRPPGDVVTLFPSLPKPPSLVSRGIDLRCCSCADIEWPAADLVIADPPWTYDQRYGASEPPYPVLTTADIVGHLERLRAPRMALWMTWPLMPEWTAATTGWRHWKWVTGGAWSKSNGEDGHYGPGHHWAGCSEPVLIYTHGSGTNTHSELRNAWSSEEHNSTPNDPHRKRHSRKPVGWMVKWLVRWVPPGGLVLDPYAGLGSVAEAVMLAGEGRRYVGAEIDPERHAQALSLLAQVRVS